ncbi:ATP-dependent DNA ligase LigA [Haloparvum alkalitolerans]|uniref:ATP-dependent DNA ligase LigA n=1 Tax=Haloparvum alkalitolerans TaxID=1042953 RepID=UPI003CEBCD56
MEFAAFAARAEELEAEPADLETVALVADLLAEAGPDLPTVTRFLLGRVFPAHDTRTLDVGPALCYEAIARAAGPNVDAADVETTLAELGEIGAVAADYDFGGQRGLAAFAGGGDGADGGDGAGSGGGATAGAGLTVAEVDAELRALAAASGAGSESTKRDALFGLFNRSEPAEAKLIARLVLGEMRLGVGEGAVRDAISEAFLSAGDAAAPEEGSDEPVVHATDEEVATVERALQVTNDYGRVAVLAREEGAAGLDEEGLEVGRPVQAMLAQAGTAADALEEWGEAAVETKFDGARVQVHYDPAVEEGTKTGDALGPALYSRNMDDVTDALPEIVEYVAERVDVPVILDGEVVAVDDAGDPLPFQEVLRRFRRKHDVDRMREEVELRLHAFDCLHADGDDLVNAPLRERHDRLAALLPDAAADVTVTDDPDEIAAVEAAALEAGHEGIMLKDPDAAYTPGDRGRNWLKRKPDVETLDLVVTGAEWGEGRRASLLGTFELSVRAGGSSGGDGGDGRDRGADAYETIGKVATGITDAELEELTDLLEPHVLAESGTEVDIRPAVVFEVGYEEIQRSPTYSSGYALRFPRFVEVRADKDPVDADSLARVERLAGDAGD